MEASDSEEAGDMAGDMLGAATASKQKMRCMDEEEQRLGCWV